MDCQIWMVQLCWTYYMIVLIHPSNLDKPTDFYYQQALSRLKSSCVWKDNNAVQQWVVQHMAVFPEGELHVYTLMISTFQIQKTKII